MVKADMKRDYYADLELPPTADEDQIKRQFRLLGRIGTY
jgi:curved DNA-binding protein CbpA